MKSLIFLYVLVSVVFVVLSYGFTDPNLRLWQHPAFVSLQGALKQNVYVHSVSAAVITAVLIVMLFLLYRAILRRAERATKLIVLVAGILLFAYPMFTYDLFNYILTAKITFFWHENPYVVMPIEIPNDPNLLFTRATNKLALYGPTWIASTALPSLAGFGNVWLSLVAFKLLSTFWFGMMLWLIWRMTKNWWNVVFFGLNPLVISEILINGHNDVAMMVLAIAGLSLARKKGTGNLVVGIASFVASVFVKGATVVLTPLFFLNWPNEKLWRAGFWLMFGVFLLTPLREELYPWYAAWFLAFAALLPKEKAQFVHGFSIALSMGLVFRHLPYIVTHEYGGSGPLWRMLSTAIPVAIFFTWMRVKKYV